MVDGVGPFDKEVAGYSATTGPGWWWRPFPDLFCVVIFLLRAGHLDLLDFALRQILAHAPNLLLVEAQTIQNWSLLCLDNRKSNRSYFTLLAHHINRSTAPLASITFPFFLATLALLDYSLPALDVITSLFNLGPNDVLAVINPRIALPYSPFSSLLLQQLAQHSDPHRLIPIVQWFTNNKSSLSTPPIARYAKSVDIFVSLLVQVDLPQIAAEFDASGNAARRQLQMGKVGQSIVELIIKNKLTLHEAGPLFKLDIEHGGLINWKEWAKLLVFGHGEGGHEWVEATEALIAKQRGTTLAQVLWHGITIELHASSPKRTTVQALFNCGAAGGLSVMDIIFHDVEEWDLLALNDLFRIQERMSPSPWFTPAQLGNALDKILALDPSRQFGSGTMHIMIHLISKVYAICIRPRSAGQPLSTPQPPAWLTLMSRAQLALLFACVWSAQPSCQPRQRILFSHSAQDFINLIYLAWSAQQQKRRDLAWHMCLPRFVTDHVRERIQYETAAHVYYLSDEADQAMCQVQMAQLLDVDREWLVQVLQFEGVHRTFTMGRWK